MRIWYQRRCPVAIPLAALFHYDKAMKVFSARFFNPVFSERPASIFPTMSALARAHDAVNLGQGFPDEDGPREILEIAARALIDGPNQYVPVEGLPVLREAVARANKRFYDLDIDAETQTLIVAGATEGLAAAFLACLKPGDEVIVFAPFYECYAPQIEAAGARAVFVTLDPPDWRIDGAALRAAVTDRTRMIVVNTPHNPTGRVFGADELGEIAAVASAHDLIVLCDEVYEHMVFDGRSHLPLMALPGMAERTIRLGSAGKTFSLTGWRIGYAVGAPDLIAVMKKAHQFIAYTCPGPFQVAIAAGLALEDAYFDGLSRTMQARRDHLAAHLARIGFECLPCEGTYFMSVDIRSVASAGAPFSAEDDRAFCEELTRRAGVAAVPVSAFYHGSDPAMARHYARFCFAKRMRVLDEAAARLTHYFTPAQP